MDILIVVDQMLTGFDSKWLNTLYIDKVLKYENIIQAFSRTNRLYGLPDKPHGTIRYYRLPHTMERNIDAAIKLYSGDKPIGLFVERLDFNLNAMNSVFDAITQLFEIANIQNFEKVPTDVTERGRFAKLYKELNMYLEAARIQGFNWDELTYVFETEKKKKTITLTFDENTYLILALRYKELFGESAGGGAGNSEVPYEIDGHLTEIDTGKIDSDYMNARFDKYLKTLKNKTVDKEAVQKTLNELHKSFASLTQEEQKYATIFLHDIQSGTVVLDPTKTFRDYINDYQFKAKNDQISKIVRILGVEKTKLIAMMDIGITDANINEYGRFDELKNTVDKSIAKVYFEELEGKTIPLFKVNIKIHNLLQKFIVEDGFEI